MTDDQGTPEGAWHAMMAAQAARDLEAAVAARHFRYEAEALLCQLHDTPHPAPEDVQRTAENLERAFRRQMKDDGWLDTTRTRRMIHSTTEVSPGLVRIVEDCLFPDGSTAQEISHAAFHDGRWGIVELHDV